MPFVHAGETLPTNPDLLLNSWGSIYLPAGLLMRLGGLFTDDDAVDLPEDSGLVAPASTEEVWSAQIIPPSRLLLTASF